MASDSDKVTPGGKFAEMAVRKGASFAQRRLEKRLRIAGYSPTEIRKIVTGQGFGKTVAITAVARLATRSVPGALVVSGGLVAKALFDRRRRKRREAAAVEEAEE